VSAPSEARTSLPADAASAGVARRFVDRTLLAWGLDGVADTATLLVSELVANAILHARSRLEVVVRQTPRVLRIEVHDSSGRLPARKHYSEDAATGRGLLLVETLAAGWGADPTADGKRVWFEIDVGQ
jgi:anti-sigma regulatory factor (Ser/Thr protein kinase)